ncbi:MBL fold metallo-hydrolase [Corallococcus macrosporus]|uniref:Metallo-beta-lactamase family protein n=1 Tax=Myxococcus fulvus (strain ATCC BAA-855 / HW-1) TaxID=483219 RepID=F8CKW8_MYXFH|nr:MBL fold metallo-hydrolase [Corallococcus macrosporus]AEI63881.1 metallo-beta-lactamase family protein [Corallococcus macrosporus]
MRTRSIVLSIAAALGGTLAVTGFVGCAATSHGVQPSALGKARPSSELLPLLAQPGPVELETVVSSDWAVERGGLINLDHPTAKAAGLVDGAEPAQVFFHALRHPDRGLFIVDTGVETAMRDAPEKAAMQGLIVSAMNMGSMKVHAPLGEWLAKQQQPLAGVFLTHLHPDHVTGMADVPAGTPVYSGPGEASERAFMNLVVQANIDRALAGKPPLSEWTYAREDGGLFDGAVDIFGDGSVWALWLPGHTPGTTAYLVRTPKGPVLLAGDISHTRWGWEHDVEPGSYNNDADGATVSFQKLRAFAKAHPKVEVRLGHQH